MLLGLKKQRPLHRILFLLHQDLLSWRTRIEWSSTLQPSWREVRIYHIFTPTVHAKSLFLLCIQGIKLGKEGRVCRYAGHSIHAGKTGIQYNIEGNRRSTPNIARQSIVQRRYLLTTYIWTIYSAWLREYATRWSNIRTGLLRKT